MKNILFCTFVLCLLSVNASAEVLYNNLYDTSGGVESVAANSPLADSFSTGASAEALTDVQLYLNSSDTSSTGSFTLS
jgi:hypothetical protein